MHLQAELERMSITGPFHQTAGLCTMRAAAIAMPTSGRSLIDCCAAADLPNMRWHTARDDAMAAAALFQHLLAHYPTTVRLTTEHLHTASWAWPSLPCGVTTPVHRTRVGHVEPHFLARLVERLPHDEEPVVDAYFAMLDDALLDRHISATEADTLLELAHELGLHKAQALTVHHTYLRDLARTAWNDGVITAEERRDLDTVATLLGLDPAIVAPLLEEERQQLGDPPARPNAVTPGGLTLRPGDKVVLTGEMRLPRAELTRQATDAGIRVTSTVSGQTRVLVAADPDSLSRKAKKAHTLGVPVVSQDAFLRALKAIPLIS